MRNLVVYLLLPLIFLGCSRKSPEEKRREAIKPIVGLPFKITVVKTPEATEQNNIRELSISYLKNEDYDKLETLAAEYRHTKECYADGTWKLQFIYSSFVSSDLVSNAAWKVRETEIKNWIKAKPESPTPRIAMSQFLMNYAWQARGSGYANTVSDAAWKIFGERMNRARDVLSEAKTLKEKCPAYGAAVISLAAGLQMDRTEFDMVFNQAIADAPDFENSYNGRAVFLLPRWHGKEHEWETDLTQSADHIGGEKGDMLYARVLWGVHHYGASNDIFEDGTLLSWERVDRGFAGIEKQFPDSLAAKNERAHLASLAGDKEKARKYFAETEGKVDLNDWNAESEYIDAVNWAYQ